MTLILNADSMKERSKKYEYFAAMAMELYELNNFQILFSILMSFASVETELDKKNDGFSREKIKECYG